MLRVDEATARSSFAFRDYSHWRVLLVRTARCSASSRASMSSSSTSAYGTDCRIRRLGDWRLRTRRNGADFSEYDPVRPHASTECFDRHPVYSFVGVREWGRTAFGVMRSASFRPNEAFKQRLGSDRPSCECAQLWPAPFRLRQQLLCPAHGARRFSTEPLQDAVECHDQLVMAALRVALATGNGAG